MIKKFNGVIPLPSGEVLDCDIEIDTTDFPLPSEESVRAFNDEVRKMHERIKTLQVIGTPDGTHYQPSGPVVDSTMAERCEEDQ